MSAVSAATLEQSFQDIAKQCSIEKTDTIDIKDSVREYLDAELAGKWLLVVDNVDSEGFSSTPQDALESIKTHLPRSGLIVFTTRHQMAADTLARANIINVDDMALEDGRTYLGKLIPRAIRDPKLSDELLKELSFLPLAITQAAAYLNRHPHISVSKYLMLVRGTEKTQIDLLSHEFSDGTRYRGSYNAVAATFILSIEQIRGNAPAAAEMLARASMFEPKLIPRPLLELQTYPSQRGTNHQTREAADWDTEMEDALGVLCSYSFLRRNDEQDLYDMHRLVHVATRLWLRDSDSGRRKETKPREQLVTIHLRNIFSRQGFHRSVNYSTYRLYLPHAIQLLQSRVSLDSADRYILCCRVALCLITDRRLQEASFWAQESYHWFQKCRAEGDVVNSFSQCLLADICADRGQFPAAIEFLQDSIDTQEKFGKHDKDLLVPRAVLAKVYGLSGNTRKAVELQEVVYAGRGDLPREDLDRIESQMSLARAYLDDEQTKAAIGLLEDALHALKQRPESVEHRLGMLYTLAEAYHADGWTEKARKVFDELTGIKETLPENHPDRAWVL